MTFELVGVDNKKRYLTAVEWGGRVHAAAERMFEICEKVERISPEFDAPQFCRDWIAVSPAEVKLTRIMVRGPKRGENGKPVMRNGAQVMTWLPYDEKQVGAVSRARAAA